MAWRLAPAYPLRSKVPFQEIMKVMKASLDARLGDLELARAIRNIVRHDERLLELIDAEAPVSGGPLARPKLIFEDPDEWLLTVIRPGTPRAGAAWRLRASQLSSGEWRSLIDEVGQPQQIANADRHYYPASAGALTRREHASVEVSSPGGFRIIIDPIFRSPLLRCASTMPPPDPGVAAAFVTHSHADHFDLATLDYLAANGTVIHVPSVPRKSLLAEEMHDALALCGLISRRCGWGSVTEVGDIRVEALPFFGEQPSALISPADADIRNWGNCYRIDTPGFSVLVLCDSGTDPSGSVLTSVNDSVRQRGPIDVVLGCLRYFYLPFEVEGLSSYYAVLPLSGLRTDHDLYQQRKLPSATLGISGTAAACAEAHAKVFLPYAHGLTGYGRPIAENPFGPGPGLDELAACRAMAEELKRIGCGTAVRSWKPGEWWTPA
jgi:L-ascorbate metabolism protein UlaG (beta-lactamase superfamily)